MPQMTEICKRFPDGKMLLTVGVYYPQPGSKNYLNAPPIPGYQFIFWDINGVIWASTNATPLTPNNNFLAFAWYMELGVGNGEAIEVYAFNKDQNQVLPDCPIVSVAPPNTPQQGCTVDNRQIAVTVTVSTHVPSDPGAVFNGWVQSGGTVNGPVLQVNAKQGDLAIAFYKQPPVIQVIGEDLGGTPGQPHGVGLSVTGSGFTPGGQVVLNVHRPQPITLTADLSNSISWDGGIPGYSCGHFPKVSATDSTTGLEVLADVTWFCAP